MSVDDELGIRRTLAAYCHLIDDGDFHRLVQEFTPDGTFAFGPKVATGRDALVAWFDENHPPHRRGKHVTVNTVVDVDGDRASARSDFVFLRHIDGALTIEAAGRYRDRLVRIDGRWMIVRRDAELMAPPPQRGEKDR